MNPVTVSVQPIIGIVLILSFIISIPLGISALVVQAESKVVNGKTIYVYDNKINLGIAAVVLFFIPLFFYLFGGTHLLR